MLVNYPMPSQQAEPFVSEPPEAEASGAPQATPAVEAYNAEAEISEALQIVLQHIALSEQEAIQVARFISPWQAGAHYEPGQYVKYEPVTDTIPDEAIYSVLAAHESKPAQTPDRAPALFKPVCAKPKK